MFEFKYFIFTRTRQTRQGKVMLALHNFSNNFKVTDRIKFLGSWWSCVYERLLGTGLLKALLKLYQNL